MKKLVRLIVFVVIAVLAVRYCSEKFGGTISLPGGLGGGGSETTEATTEGNSGKTNGGWFTPKDKKANNDNKEVPDDIRDLERQLGIGTDDNGTSSSSTVNIPANTPAAISTPLTFKGIPITGTSSAFGKELVKAGFSSSGNGTYTGDFAGYSNCTVTPVGNNPVQEVRVDFPVIKDWDSLEKSYDSLQASLTQKYGIEPVTAPNSNLAVYNLPNGTIYLDADVKNKSSWHVILRYSNSSTEIIPSGRNPIDDL